MKSLNTLLALRLKCHLRLYVDLVKGADMTHLVFGGFAGGGGRRGWTRCILQLLLVGFGRSLARDAWGGRRSRRSLSQLGGGPRCGGSVAGGLLTRRSRRFGCWGGQGGQLKSSWTRQGNIIEVGAQLSGQVVVRKEVPKQQNVKGMG